jgi:hypothetical protein
MNVVGDLRSQLTGQSIPGLVTSKGRTLSSKWQYFACLFITTDKYKSSRDINSCDFQSFSTGFSCIYDLLVDHTACYAQTHVLFQRARISRTCVPILSVDPRSMTPLTRAAKMIVKRAASLPIVLNLPYIKMRFVYKTAKILEQSLLYAVPTRLMSL